MTGRLRQYGTATSAVRTLWQAGAIDRDARITTGVVLGDEAMRDFADRLEPLWLTDVTHTHDVAAISAIPRCSSCRGPGRRRNWSKVSGPRSRTG